MMSRNAGTFTMAAAIRLLFAPPTARAQVEPDLLVVDEGDPQTVHNVESGADRYLVFAVGTIPPEIGRPRALAAVGEERVHLAAALDPSTGEYFLTVVDKTATTGLLTANYEWTLTPSAPVTVPVRFRAAGRHHDGGPS
jgi:hypothetical protein